MNTTHTRKKLIAGAVSAVVVAAAGTAALPGVPSSAPAPRYPTGVAISSAMPALAAVVTPNSLYAAAGGPAVAVLGPNGSLALPDGYYIAAGCPGCPGCTGASGVERAQRDGPCSRPRHRSDLVHAVPTGIIVGSR